MPRHRFSASRIQTAFKRGFLGTPIIPTTINTPSNTKGGNITIIPGKGYKPHPNQKIKDGSIIFKDAQGNEVLRFDPGGKVSINGNLAGSDKEVYDMVIKFFRDALSP